MDSSQASSAHVAGAHSEREGGVTHERRKGLAHRAFARGSGTRLFQRDGTVTHMHRPPPLP